MKIGAARRSSQVSTNPTSIVRISRTSVTIMLMPDRTDPVPFLAADREVAARAALLHLEPRLEHRAATAERTSSAQPAPDAAGGRSAASGQGSPPSRGSHAPGGLAPPQRRVRRRPPCRRGRRRGATRGGAGGRRRPAASLVIEAAGCRLGAIEPELAGGLDRVEGQGGRLVGQRLDRLLRGRGWERRAVGGAQRGREPGGPQAEGAGEAAAVDGAVAGGSLEHHLERSA